MKNSLDNTIADISEALGILALRVRSEALAGLGSRNKTAELILLPVLQRIYGAQGLANTNSLAANFPGVDLYDPASGLGVQVTSEKTAAKITKTIRTLAGGSLPLKRLVVVLVADPSPRFRAHTRANWQRAANGRFLFEPESDVLPFERLLARILQLQPSAIVAIANELQALVNGTHVVDLLPHLRRQVEDQLAEEKRIARYIPDVFVETRDTKYQARCFAHPTLFARRIAGWFDLQPFNGLNRLASMSGVPAVNMPSTDGVTSAETPQSVAPAAKNLINDLERLDRTLAVYRELARAGATEVPRDESRAHVFNETRHYLSSAASMAQHRVGQRIVEFRCVTAQLFLLTGPAGQGKTNFLCDFAERFLLRHDIPCSYITARQMSRLPGADLTEVARRLIFPSVVASLEEGLASLASACAGQRTPFVLVIDGLNEHPDVRAFAGQLEHLLETLLRYPHVRVLMTCRSEFLQQRFGALLSGPLEPFLHLSEALGLRIDDEEYGKLVDRYFNFFKLRHDRVSPHVVDFLRRDILLLRFFCEAYGGRGRGPDYHQPYITGVYRNEIFHRYTKDKMGRAQEAVANDRTVARPLGRTAKIRQVLSLVASHMMETGQFSDVPRSVVPTDLDAELTALLDEELVLRHDLAPSRSLLSDPPEVLNFTFDELRDFLLAEYLLGVHGESPHEFARLLAPQLQSTTQSTEGLQRFLFYASRVPENREFFESYRTHPWYSVVYDTAIFDVPPTHLNSDDRRIVETALTAGGARAQHFAHELARCWQRSIFPVLNLEVLLSVARREDSSFFTGVMVPTFGRAHYGRDSLGEAICRFVERELLPSFAPAREHEYDPIFRLVLLLLPIGATPTLDSPAGAVFRELILSQPEYAFGILKEALEAGIGWHRPFLWRLLSLAALEVDMASSLIPAAESDVANADSEAPLRREATRFLGYVLPARSSS